MHVGGDYVGSGTAGCVFTPGVRCKEHPAKVMYPDIYQKSIGKLFAREKDFVEELGIHHHIIERIDPHHEFTVPLRMACAIAPGKTEKRDIQVKCMHATKPKSKSKSKSKSRTHKNNPPGVDSVHPFQKQLIYAHGGKDWMAWGKEHIHDADGFIQLFLRLGPMLEGLYTMQRDLGYIHNDIKTPNLLYDSHHTNRVYLIDFGIATNQTALLDQTWIIRYHYPFFPIDFKVYDFMVTHKSVPNAIHLRTMLIDNLAEYVPRWKDWFDRLGINLDQTLSNYVRWLEALSHPRLTQKQVRSAFDALLDRVDIYGLGVSLLDLYRIMDLDEHDDLDRLDRRPASAKSMPSTASRMPSTASRMPSTASTSKPNDLKTSSRVASGKQGYKRHSVSIQQRRKLELILNFVRHCIYPNPYERYTLVEALRRYYMLVPLLIH